MKSTPQQQRSRQTVERLLDAANVEFALHGVSGATTTTIAERAEVSVGSLYRFFGDKRALADALSERYLEDATAVFVPIVASIDDAGDVVDAVRRVVRAAADLQTSHAGYYRITQDDVPDGRDSPARVVRSRLVDVFSDVLDRLDVGPSEAVRRRVVDLTTETVRHTLAISDPSAPDRLERTRELEELAVGYFVHRLDLDRRDV